MATKMYLPPKGESRRGVLKKGFFGGVLLFLGGGAWLALRPGKHEPDPEGGLTTLSRREYALVAAVARRMVPTGGPWPTIESIQLPRTADHLIGKLDETTRIELRQLLNFLETGIAGLLTVGAGTPFSLLSPQQQDAVLLDWATSRLVLRRTGYHALRGLVLGIYFANPAVWPPVGYGGPPPLHDATAKVWKGGDEPRPPGLGVWVEPSP